MTPTPATLDAATLLTGPRGRRLCLEIAGMAAQAASDDQNQNDFGMARFYAAYNLDPDRGQSVVMVGPGPDSELPTPTPEEVAMLLDSVPLPNLTASAMLEALTATVNSARYWQEPDGDDVLAATPELRRALHRFAQLVTDSPHARSWTAPVDPLEQWTVTFTADPPRPPAESQTAVLALEQWHKGTIAEESGATTDRPRDPTANFSGTWWSCPPSGLTSSTHLMTGYGPLGLHLVEDGFGEEEAFAERLAIPATARIYEIDSPEAWAQLCRERSLDVTASRRHDWYRATGRVGMWAVPDWSRFQDKYDGVHLTVAGYLATAGVAITVDEEHSSVLAGWGPDATFWFRDFGVEAESRQMWAQVHDDPAWSLLSPGLRSLTVPARSSWSLNHGGYQNSSETVLLGTGEALWQRARDDVLCWKVKTRSGFTVNSSEPVAEGQRVNVTASLIGVKVVEPVEVVAVVDEHDRVGFAYRTLPGHPVSGEEAFIVHRFDDDVLLTIRSLTKAAPQQPWRALFPALMVVQKFIRRRYLRALR